MAMGFLGPPQSSQPPGIGTMRPGPNFQSGQQGWLGGYGNALPMGQGDHMPLVSASQSHAPRLGMMAPGQQGQLGPPSQAGGPGGRTSAIEPWNQPGWQQPAPTYNPTAWGSNAIGWGGAGSAPAIPHGDPAPVGAPTQVPPVAPIAAGSGGPGSMNSGMAPGQWQSIIQALSGMGSNMFQTPPGAGMNYSDPNFINSLMNGLGGYQ